MKNLYYWMFVLLAGMLAAASFVGLPCSDHGMHFGYFYRGVGAVIDALDLT